MAIVKGPFQLSGSVSGVSFYTRRGSTDVIMRSKGGVKGDRMKRMPQFDGFRQQQKEWSGVTRTASAFRMALGGLHRLADYNITPALNSICNSVQKNDKLRPKGSRWVDIAGSRTLFSGFNLNRTYYFNSVLRVALRITVDRQVSRASVSFPCIQVQNDVLNLQKLPYFRLLVVLGAVSDMVFDPVLNDYKPAVPALHGAAVVAESEWLVASATAEAIDMTVCLMESQKESMTDHVTLVLSAGIEFGVVGYTGMPQAQKYAGSAKVLELF